ncbi:MAG: hypothetical protein HQL84_02980 [Magnetococcales bacterium]|nr:hypothetical protein [Magnetococcales bacterium]MBF0148990.1 hypothetical protein [Magnetococcales bacterium]MBF0603056.1 hypothetical protein [Magnetococcales bacterium]
MNTPSPMGEAVAPSSRKFLLAFFLLELLFLATVWPYLSGRMIYAPRAVLGQGTFASAHLSEAPLTARDQYGQADFINQERNFLSFYRESLLNLELPFWNERVFGGMSQEDSMVYSYLSPFHLPWLLIKNEKVAKGVQMFLLLNFGAFGFFWWARILRLSPEWSLMVAIFGTLTPLALHFLAHTHQPGLYYGGLCILAAFHRFIETAKPRFLLIFFGLVVMAVAINFISILLFIGIFLAIVALGHFIHAQGERSRVAKGTLFGVAAFLLAVMTMIFFLAPILLESRMVREPVALAYPLFAPWTGLGSLLDAFLVSQLWLGIYLPFMILLPLLLAAWFGRGRRALVATPAVVWGLLSITLFVILVNGFLSVNMLFREWFPGMKYSHNAPMRMLFFGNLFAMLLLAWLAESVSRANLLTRFWKWGAHGFILILFFANLLAVALAPLGAVVPEKLMTGKLVDLVHLFQTPDRWGAALVGVVIVVLFFLFWHHTTQEHRGARPLALAFLVGVCYVGIYQFHYPNLPTAQDPASHPIFAGLTPGARALTLETCTSENSSFYRFEATNAGFRTLDGPLDTGLFIKTRQFWYPLNHVEQYNREGANLFEVLWICAEYVIEAETGALSPAAARLFNSLGIRYLFTDREIGRPDVELVQRVGDLRAYALSDSWSDVSFFPGGTTQDINDMLNGLARGAPESIAAFDRLNGVRRELSAARVSNLMWQISAPEDLVGIRGALFMNHPLEYYTDRVVPVFGLPLEGKWTLTVAAGKTIPFPLTAVPFRISDLVLEGGGMTVHYDLSHYKVWLPLSGIALAGFFWLMSACRKWAVVAEKGST